jgi:LL-H family phage holin
MNIQFNDVVALLSVCMPYVIASAVYLFKHLESRLPANARYDFEQVVQTVVSGIEQKNAGSVPGADKKAQAVAAVSDIAKNLGLKWVTPTMIDLAIEAAVAELPKSQSPVATVAQVPAV